MSKIGISKDLFSKFLLLSSLQKECENKELYLQFTKESVVSLAASAGKSIALRGEVKDQFEDWGEVGIDDLSFLANFVDSQTTEKIFLKKTENNLISDLGSVKFTGVLRNPKYITNIFPKEKYEQFKKEISGNEFVLKSEQVKSILSYFGKIKASNIFLVGEGDNLNIKFEKLGNELSLDFKLENKVESFDVKVPTLFMDLLYVISDYDLTVSIKNEFPIYISLSEDKLKFEYFVVQMVRK